MSSDCKKGQFTLRTHGVGAGSVRSDCSLTLLSRSASAAKLKRVQGSEALDRGRTDSKPTESFTDAERAISTVAKKLKSDLSVEYQVNECVHPSAFIDARNFKLAWLIKADFTLYHSLILQATDVNNLGAIYYGWQPYL